MRRLDKDRMFCLLVLVVALLACPQSALAATLVVGNGTPASCTEMALKDALIIAETVGGATIRFKCGSGPVTIALSQVTTSPGIPVLLVIPNNTTVDGGGLITLDGTSTATVAFVDRDTTVVLKHLSIIRGDGEENGPGGILNLGTLSIDHTTLAFNITDVVGGGINNRGTLAISHSNFVRNRAFFPGGGIFNSGMLTVRKSVFEGNSTAFDGGGIAGSVTVDDSTFVGNDASDGTGGAIAGSGKITRSTFSENLAFSGGAIFGTATLTVGRSTFSDNRAAGGWGGGIYHIAGALTVRKSTFAGNGSFAGGALLTLPDSVASLTDSTLSGNAGGFSGGGIVNFGTLTIDDSTLSGNTANLGGGIFNAGTLAVDDSIITQNTANSAGGGIYVCIEGQVPPQAAPQLPCRGTLSLKRTSVSENTPDDIFP